MHPIVLPIQVNDLVAVQPTNQRPFIGQVLCVDTERQRSSEHCPGHPGQRDGNRQLHPDWVPDRVPGEGRISA